MEEKKERGLLLAGTMFLFDVENARLREQQDPHNTIPFNKMKDTGRGYYFNYDLNLKNIARGDARDEDVVRITTPMMIELDAKGMAQKYGVAVSALKGLSDLDLIADRQLLARRLNGNLPSIDLAGLESFNIDLQAGVLSSRTFIGSIIKLKDLTIMGTPENKYVGFYDLKARKVVDVDASTITQLPENVVFIEVPPMEKLDPVGLARLQGLEDLYHVRQFGIERDLSIKITPLENTILDLYVIQNQESQKNIQKLTLPAVTEKAAKRQRIRGRGI